MINTKKDSEHRYILRSCLNCNNLQKCQSWHNIDSPMIWCDCAKYGCVRYSGIYSDEKSKNEKRRGKSNKQKG